MRVFGQLCWVQGEQGPEWIGLLSLAALGVAGWVWESPQCGLRAGGGSDYEGLR